MLAVYSWNIDCHCCREIMVPDYRNIENLNNRTEAHMLHDRLGDLNALYFIVGKWINYPVY